MILGEILRELKLKKYGEQAGRCVVCNNDLASPMTAELAHHIPQTKRNLKKYGAEIIHHESNMSLVCSKKCNSAVLIGEKPIRIMAHVQEIIKELQNGNAKNKA